MHIARRASGQPSTPRTDTFTGEVWMDPVLPANDGTTINDVFFAPGARTHWHHHERGQIILVLAGSGLISTDDTPPERIEAGDMIWTPRGERHWHGASPDSFLIHRAISLGATSWAEEVADAAYHAGGG